MNEKNRTYSSTFDNTTMYDLSEKININLVVKMMIYNFVCKIF